MSARTLVLTATLAVALSAPALSTAFSQHSHAGGDVALQSMSLDQGRKWPTDAALRGGMSDIRASMSDALPRIHAGRFGGGDYAALADAVQGRIDFIVANCKLPEEADSQLHLALTHMLDGVAAMKSADNREQGALAVVNALDAYGAHFDHPGWKALAD
ncbi:hypothetical protein SLNSH_03195 [Alsobacter soli]|uniref:DnrO protein n=1 Tax=Alsobacter soli TaxID=2109933 RepID=A0A2T1HXT3_9HYPH|nr:hypothetical protein [Alsobacter soli]PSC06309.1 hypothetical protein SLNSH_03195 [Alsobacter soli]